MQEIYDFLKQCGTYYLATVEKDQPRVRPFGTINLFEGKTLHTNGESETSFQANDSQPKVELCAMNGDHGFGSPPRQWRTTEWKPDKICWTIIPNSIHVFRR